MSVRAKPRSGGGTKMLTMSTTRTLAVVVVLVAASLAGGAYAGYQSGYNDSLLKLAPDV